MVCAFKAHTLVVFSTYTDVVDTSHRQVLHGTIRQRVALDVSFLRSIGSTGVSLSAHVMVAVAGVFPYHRTVHSHFSLAEVYSASVLFC